MMLRCRREIERGEGGRGGLNPGDKGTQRLTEVKDLSVEEYLYFNNLFICFFLI